MRTRPSLESYIRIMPTALWWPYGGVLFLMSKVTYMNEVTLYSQLFKCNFQKTDALPTLGKLVHQSLWGDKNFWGN